MVVEMKGV